VNLLKFQSEAVQRVEVFLQKFLDMRRKGTKKACRAAWDQLITRLGSRPYCEVNDSNNAEIPSVSVVIPTGGGKTITAIACAIKALKIRNSYNNVIVWVVPSDAIYDQTKKYLEVGYLRDFSINSGFNELILKLNGDSWTDYELGSNVLTVILVTQQSIFSEKDDRIFSRRSDLFQSLSYSLLNGKNVSSLKELFEAIKPVFVIDEAHKTYTKLGRNFFRENSLAWCLLEFSATPKEYSSNEYPNVLFSVKADRLVEEQLLKTPLQLHLSPSASVENILDQVIKLRHRLENGLSAEGYLVKPKVLISCFRTSEKQAAERNSAHSIRDLLIGKGVANDKIAFKTSEKNDLGEVDIDSSQCVFEYILTKQALVEGWDAKSVYIVVLVNEIGARLTNFQIVGRGLRQPKKLYFKDPELNSLSVFSAGIKHDDALKALKSYLAGEGLENAMLVSGNSTNSEKILFKPYGSFSAPIFSMKEERAWFDALGIVRAIKTPCEFVSARSFLRYAEINLESSVSYSVDDGITAELDTKNLRVREPMSKYLWRCRFISRLCKLSGDIFYDSVKLINWVETQYDTFLRDPSGDSIFSYDPEGVASYVFNTLKMHFELQRSAAYIDAVRSSKLSRWNFDSKNISIVAEKTQQKFQPFRNSLIGDTPKSLFNNQELDFAYFLDERGFKWLRNNPSKGWYHISGGLSGRFYPDFVVLEQESAEGVYEKVILIETKGGHLLGNLDSQEKIKACEEITRISNGVITVIFDGFEEAKRSLDAYSRKEPLL